MIPDILISKYLDADLSPHEDVELRKRLSNEAGAREEFDAAILIHIAMSCSEECTVPKDVEDSTLEAVFAVIDKATAAPMRSAARSPRRVGSVLATLATIFLFLNVPVADLNLPLPRGFYKPASAAMGATVLLAAQGKRHHQQAMFTLDTSEPQQQIQAYPPKMADVSVESVVTDTAYHPSRFLSLDSSETDLAETSHNSSADIASPVPNTSIAVVLTTFVGSGLTGTNQNVSKATIISQSLGYTVTENTVVGLEFGTITYQADVTTTANVRLSGPAVSSNERRPPGGGKLLGSDHAASDVVYGQYSTVSASSNTGYWGAAFVQQTVFRYSLGEVNVRAGGGVDGGGLLGFGRLQGQIKLQPWISFSIGCEARTSSFRQGASPGSASGTAYGVLVSAVAGIQIRP